MRGRRIKIAAEEAAAVYHCISRTVNGEFLFKPADRELLRVMIWKVAEFCGVEVLTYAILSNHFHVLVRVPQKTPVSDSELLRRYRRLYPSPTKYQTMRLEVIEASLATGGVEGDRWRERIQRLMGDVSQYLRLLKQRFSTAYNRRHERFGTLWAERFKSELVEEGAAVRTLAAYIDLNGVRAGLADDPKDYRFCGYAEAVAGNKRARSGLELVCGEGWERASSDYRQLLFGTGSDPMTLRKRISEDAADRVLNSAGTLSVAELLRCRVRFFSDGAILGSRIFVESMLAKSLRGIPESVRERRPKPVLPEGPWAWICTLRRQRGRVLMRPAPRTTVHG